MLLHHAEQTVNHYPVSEEELQIVEFVVWLFVVILLIVLAQNLYG